MSRKIKVLYTGIMEFSQSVNLQHRIIKSQNLNDFRNVLILTEHYPVYTIGLRTKDYSKRDEEKLKELGAQFFKTNRGGLITFHGPGQLVVYPILNLKDFNPSIRWYIGQLEKTIIDTCKAFSLKASSSPYTGVWINDKKVCSIGVHASRYITTHGLALNCTTDLRWFSHIDACGIKNKSVTSLTEELHYNITIENVIPEFLKCFKNIFECEIGITERDKDNILKF